VTCALVLSDNQQAVEVLRLFKPDRVFLAYEGRRLLETLKEFNVAVCTYLPFDVPPSVKTAGPLTFLEMCYGEPVLVL
jgi:predicted P-loop ATPase/GTPase